MTLPPPTGISLPQGPPDAPSAPPGIEEPASEPTVQPEFKSPMLLTPVQFDKLQSDTLLRIQELRREMGLTTTNDVIPGSWMWLRRCHEQYYQGDLSWRKALGSVFPKSNFTLGSGLRHTRYLSARVQDDLLGTSPFLGAMGRNPDKEKLAQQVEDYVQGEIERGQVRPVLREAQKVAIYRNECVVKSSYIDDSTPYYGEATVLVDATTGEPILTPEKQLYVHQDDNLVPDPSVEGLMVLETDPSFRIAQNPNPGLVTIPAQGDQPEIIARYQDFDALPQKLTIREGVFCEALDYRSFLCPLRIKSVHEADSCFHLYLDTPNRVRRVYGGIDVSQQYFSWWDAPGQEKPKFEQGETSNPPTVIYQQIVIAEGYRRIDPDETGEDKEIFVVLDLTNQKVIYFNYLANHMAKRPFEPIPGVEQVPGRWYGRGIYGMLEDHLLYEDLELNRANFKNSKDATIQFAYRAACEDWRDGKAPVIGDGKTIWIDESWNPEGGKKPIWRENLYEKVETDLEMMNIMRQSADSLVGALSMQSAAQSDLRPSETATGDQLIQQSADVLVRATETEQSEAINRILEQVVDIALERMDRTKFFLAKNADQLVTLNRDEVRGLSRDVRLLLTRSKSTQLLTTSKELIDIGIRFWELMQTNLPAAQALRPAFVSQAKALESNDADTMFPEITDDQVEQWQQSQSSGQQEPPKRSISAKLTDLAPSERAQVLSQEGIRPASAAELSAQQAQQTAQAAVQQSAQRPPEHNLKVA